MRIHPRTEIVEEAGRKLDQFLIDLETEHDLTRGELFQLLGRAIAILAKYQIRVERHPNATSKGGDEA